MQSSPCLAGRCTAQRPFAPALPASKGLRRASRCVRRALRTLESCQSRDVLEVKLSDGATEIMEVVQGWDAAESSAVIMRQGQLLRLAAVGGRKPGGWQLAFLGDYLQATDATVTCFPELSKVLPSMVSKLDTESIAVDGATVVDSLDNLLQQVQQDPTLWRDGNAPGAPAQTQLQQALFTAGELAALLTGQRGLAIIQLWNGWDPSKGQPLYNPLAISMLEKVLAAPGVGYCSSLAPGGVGLTGVVYADREPFASWAKHLASFGCQANVVAGSAYFKLLIGQLLGYKLENVLGYIAASGEPASAQLQQQVAKDIKGLSKVKPKLPWSPDDKNIKKAKTSSKPAAGKPAGGFGSNKPAAGFGAKARR